MPAALGALVLAGLPGFAGLGTLAGSTIFGIGVGSLVGSVIITGPIIGAPVELRPSK